MLVETIIGDRWWLNSLQLLDDIIQVCGLPAIGSSAFGVPLVSGQSLVAYPPANTIAYKFRMPLGVLVVALRLS